MTALTDVAGSDRSTDQLPLPATTQVAVPADGEPVGTAAPPPVDLPRVIGLDLSLANTGISDGRTTWLVKSKGKETDGLPERQTRLRRLRAEVITHCEGAQLIVVEGPSYGSHTGHAHDRGGLWWLVVMALAHRGIQVVEVPPAVLKKYATGKGSGPKGAVIEAATRRLPHVDTAGDDNRADALWLHTIGAGHLTGAHPVPAAQVAALAKVRWPS